VSELTTVLSEAFDIDNQEGSPEFEVLPKGNYVAAITKAEVGPLKTGRGQAITLTWEIEGGKYARRLIFDRIIVQHESAEAMRIGRQMLKDICVAVQVSGALTDLAVLLNKPALIYAVVEQDANGEYPPKNRVRRVKSIARPEAGNGIKPVKPEFDDKIPF
jgi:hypothetical protein